MGIVEQKEKVSFKDRLISIKDWILSHSKIVMPVVLVLCVAITVLIAINANKHDALQKEAEAAAKNAGEDASADIDLIEVPEYALEENAHPEINAIVKEYYDAQASGDMDTVAKYNTGLDEMGKLRVQVYSKYIESYDDINVYTKPGLTENAYVAYVTHSIKFVDNDTALPGMQTYYIGMDPDGNYFINDATYDDEIYEYISNLSVQDDVVDLNNKVVVAYNDLLTSDELINDYVVYIKSMVKEEVGELVAQAEVPEVEPEEPATTEDDTTAATATSVVVNKVKAKERVNIRKSDSKDSDKVGSASEGETFELIEKLPNGWTKIKYNDSEAYINSDYLEDVETVKVEIAGTDDGNANNDTTAAEPTDSTKVNGKVVVNDSGVRIRKEPNTSADILGTVYTGEKFDFIEETGEWTKIKYDDGYGYIKSSFVDKKN